MVDNCRAFLMDPEKKAAYTALAKKGKNAYNTAISDFLRSKVNRQSAPD